MELATLKCIYVLRNTNNFKNQGVQTYSKFHGASNHWPVNDKRGTEAITITLTTQESSLKQQNLVFTRGSSTIFVVLG